MLTVHGCVKSIESVLLTVGIQLDISPRILGCAMEVFRESSQGTMFIVLPISV